MSRRLWVAAGLLALAAACRPHDLPKVAELKAILASRNDNDPRLDRDFDALTAADKAAFRALYRALPPEKRNELGTVVYLLGRNVSGPEDWAFLRAAAAEPRCWSLADCGRRPSGPSDPADVGDDVTLAYPALVALKRAE
ncbi:MAG: hypothetical protein KGL53_01175, partial [Elusimicrobia bacterium]|nr:hypothetical protein [Elusimicrobiota bacterium]